jgi:hypothetical protein
VLALRLDRYAVEAALPFAFGGIPVWRHLRDASEQARELAVYGAAGVAALAFALVPRRAAWLLPAALAAALGFASVEASRHVAAAGRTQQARFLGPEPRWIDRAANARAAYLYDGDPDWDGVWENVFWNERIEAVYRLPGTAIVGPLPQRDARVAADGTLEGGDGTPIAERTLVASTAFTFHGTQLAEAPQVLPRQAGLRLWVLEGTPRVSTRAEQFAPNGDVYGGGTAWVTVYDCGRAQLRLTLLPKEPLTLTVRRDERVWRRLRLEGGTVWRGTVPTPRGRGGRACRLSLSPTGLLGTTVVQLERLGGS